MQIKAKILADSICPRGHRLVTFELDFNRYLLPELNTHRMFSRNSASSRAIPFNKMVKSVQENPFIPIAWQKDHKGMQGTEYFTDKDVEYGIKTTSIEPYAHFNGTDWYDTEEDRDSDFVIGQNDSALYTQEKVTRPISDVLKENWLQARDRAVEEATRLHDAGVTKQLCNRLLEPFMMHKVILTATEFDGFFEQRCSVYTDPSGVKFRSKKDYIKSSAWGNSETWTDLDWLQINEGHSEIHMMALAEAMWDAMNESTPKQLKEGEWHIPFGDTFDEGSISELFKGEYPAGTNYVPYDFRIATKIKIAIARCARVSYLTHDGKEDYEADIKLYDFLIANKHMSPLEHIARCMTNEEYSQFYKGVIDQKNICLPEDVISGQVSTEELVADELGWCNNLRGWIQHRWEVENES